jgi:PAS domain S-box-containing protein
VTTVYNNSDDGGIQILVDDIAVPVYTCNQHGQIISFNKAAVELWGRRPEPGECWDGAWRVYDLSANLITAGSGPMARSVTSGVPVTGEEVLIERPDGSRRYVAPHPILLKDESGNLRGATCTLMDITEQKQSENKQAMLAAIVESSTDAIISKTLDGVITSWNKAAERLFGYKDDEAIGRNITMLIPEDRLSEETHIIGMVSSNQRVDHFETIRVDKFGNELNLSLTISPIKDSKGNVIGASKIARDITRQKLAEERMQRYAENLETLNSFGKLIAEDLDVQEILQKVTDVTTQLTGAGFGAFFYNQVDEGGESYTLYTLSGVDRSAFEGFRMPRNTAVFHPTFTGQGVIRSDNITQDPRYGKNDPYYGMPPGHLPVVSYLAVPVISKNGFVIGGLFYGHPEEGVFSTEHENLVSAIASQAAIALDNAKLYQDIKVLNAKKDEFIGLASHELKTPVTSINGYLQIIERSLEHDHRNRSFVAKTRQQVTKLSNLIADLLDVSKIITGKLPFEYADFDLLELMHDSLDIFRQTYTTHRITFVNNTATEHLMVNADPQRLEQVLINLVSNAVKYSPGAEEVVVTVAVTPAGIRVSVQDYGIGIEQEQYSRIFSRFYRVENLAAHMSGLGIGLYICDEIISRHKGKIWVDSEFGKGSTFHFEIPAKAI